MRLSVVIPSRLEINPNMADQYDADPELWLDRAVFAIRHQSGFADAEIVVGLDADQPRELPARFRDVVAVRADSNGQAVAVNAAVRAATGDVLAFCESDDYFESRKLEAQVQLLNRFDMVTCSQREHDEQGNYVRVNVFATPSTWCLRRETWDRIGGFDESYRYHVDTEWLCRANNAGLKRLHIVDTTTESSADEIGRQWLGNIQRFSEIGHVGNDRPLVNRCVNPEGGMQAIERGMKAAAKFIAEHFPGAHEPPMLMNMIFADETWQHPDVTPELLKAVEPARVSMKEHRRMYDEHGGGRGW